MSPVFMNIFLHQLDVKILSFSNKESNLCYVRYADDDDLWYQKRVGFWKTLSAVSSEVLLAGFESSQAGRDFFGTDPFKNQKQLVLS